MDKQAAAGFATVLSNQLLDRMGSKVASSRKKPARVKKASHPASEIAQLISRMQGRP
jgi:hypothetical protein